MSQMEKYRFAWQHYLMSCEKHEIECTIDFSNFVQSLTMDQVEQLYLQSQQFSHVG